MKHLHLAFAALLMLSGCARNLDTNNYVSSSTSGVVLEGVVVSARAVTVSDTDRLGGNGAGIIGGGIAGGVAGSTIGQGKGAVLGAVGGAAIGAVAGAVIQDQLSTSDGMEYIVKLKDENIGSPYKTRPAAQSKTELISVVQGKDVVFSAGQKVYVIYNDDRPRMTARD